MSENDDDDDDVAHSVLFHAMTVATGEAMRTYAVTKPPIDVWFGCDPLAGYGVLITFLWLHEFY